MSRRVPPPDEIKWRASFYDFTAYMRGRGWKQAFVMFGQTFIVPGVFSVWTYPERTNDNHSPEASA